jgi:hypothetical protein
MMLLMKTTDILVRIVPIVLAAAVTGCAVSPASHAREPYSSVVAPPNEHVRLVAGAPQPAADNFRVGHHQ